MGIPKREKTGEQILARKEVIPLARRNATATMIAAMYGKISTTRGIDFFAPATNVLYVGTFFYFA